VEKILKILSPKIKAWGLEKGFLKAQLYRQWDDLISNSLGEKFKKKSQPLKISRDTLIVSCLNPLWANEFFLQSQILLNFLEKKFPKLKIKKIKFVIR